MANVQKYRRRGARESGTPVPNLRHAGKAEPLSQVGAWRTSGGTSGTHERWRRELRRHERQRTSGGGTSGTHERWRRERRRHERWRLTATIASAITTATAFTAAALCKMLPAIDMARSGDGHLCKLLNLALQRCGEVRFLRGLRLRIR